MLFTPGLHLIEQSDEEFMKIRTLIIIIIIIIIMGLYFTQEKNTYPVLKYNKINKLIIES